MIANLSNDYDLFLGYSWSNKPQGVCGHLYECIEYYTILKSHFKVGIFICEDMPRETMERAIRDKYDFTDTEIDELFSDTFFFDVPKILKAPAILLVDGGFSKLKDKHILTNTLMAFPCGDVGVYDQPKISIFHDERIYGPCTKGVHYVKKILFGRYRKVTTEVEYVNLLYVTRGPREVNEALYEDVAEALRGDFILATNVTVNATLSNRFTVMDLPIPNLFEKFSTYVYTPTIRRFDCSPRFIAECRWYDKQVIYHGIDYWDADKGLFWRQTDINDNFDSIILRDGDEIIDLVKHAIG